MLQGALLAFHIQLCRVWWCLGGAAGSECAMTGVTTGTLLPDRDSTSVRLGQGRFRLGVRKNSFPKRVLRSPGMEPPKSQPRWPHCQVWWLWLGLLISGAFLRWFQGSVGYPGWSCAEILAVTPLSLPCPCCCPFSSWH